MSCSTKSLRNSEALTKLPISCRAKAGFSLQTSSERMRGSLQYVLLRDKNLSSLKLMILNPLGLTEALVELDSKRTDRLVSQGKETRIKTSPLLSKWISKQIFEELWFASGQTPYVNEKHIHQDSESSEFYQNRSRMIRCENILNSNPSPLERSIRRCHLKDQDFELWINFTSLSC